jgi:hypothetical protein
MKRESLELQPADWEQLQRVAQAAGSIYSGRPSWRRLMMEIARGKLVVSRPHPPAPVPPRRRLP